MSNSATPDPRIHAYRPDLADISLSHTVKADRFVEPILRQCVRGVVPLLAEPTLDAKQVSQIRYGEFIDIFETLLIRMVPNDLLNVRMEGNTSLLAFNATE